MKDEGRVTEKERKKNGVGGKREARISVRSLVDFILRSGDLDNRFTGSIRGIEGTRAHQKLQRSRGDGYQAEVFLSRLVETPQFRLLVEGRADGIFTEGERVFIEEIKSTVKPLEALEGDHHPLHWSQAKCYAYIYGEENNLEELAIQLSYFQLETEEVRCFRKVYSLPELRDFFAGLTADYLSWVSMSFRWIEERDSTIRAAVFPFPDYRKGQRKLAVAAYRTISEEKKVFIQAPTGIGKTISVLFPAVKALAEGYGEKIFYLTAKTITRKAAEEALDRLLGKGLSLKYLTLTAKEKICFLERTDCNPEICPYARGHFNRVNEALQEMLQSENRFNRELIEEYARRYQLCPFELSLDLSLWVDCIIGDYNYVFDPRVSLKRFFSEKGEYLFLIDEAHNLVERSREMFSAGLGSAQLTGLSGLPAARVPVIKRGLAGLKKYFRVRQQSLSGRKELVEKEAPEDLYPLLRRLTTGIEEWLIKVGINAEGYEDFLQFYFELLAFIRISELYDRRYLTYYQLEQEGERCLQSAPGGEGGCRSESDGEEEGKYEPQREGESQIRVRLYCLDPSYLLSQVLALGRAAVFFSATLTPLNYFRTLLGGEEEDYLLELPSPFPAENHCLLLAGNLSTRYRHRQGGLKEIAQYIQAVSGERKGNYLVFFPSYQYLSGVVEEFKKSYSGVRILVQSPLMSEGEREEFLQQFLPGGETLIGFAVLGGIFGEGIDLQGERLLGTVIVGIGHPQICLERNILQSYFQQEYGLGYEYAYIFPGINKVLQAAGRTIRSSADRGLTLLVGDRFTSRRYRRLLPGDWQDIFRVNSPEEAGRCLCEFWKKAP